MRVIQPETANGRGALIFEPVGEPKNTRYCDLNTADLKALPRETCGYGKDSRKSNNVRSSSR